MRIAAVPSATGEALAKELEELFREHYALIYRTAYTVTGSRQDAEDVLQTIFLRLLRRLPPDLGTNPKGYLYRAAVNLSLNTVRARKRQSATDSVEHLPASVQLSPADADDEIRRSLLSSPPVGKPHSGRRLSS